jgi:uncharacterized protein
MMMFYFMRHLFVFLLLLVVPTFIFSKEIPNLKSRVMDETWTLSPDFIRVLEQKLQVHERETSNQIAVYIISSLEGEVLEDYSLRVAETWQLGTKKNDNGVLLLISLDDRLMRIEVGYGLEGHLTDVLCHRIIKNEITPHFKNKEYEEGIKQGINAILGAIDGRYTMPPEKDWSHLGPLSFLGDMDGGQDGIPWIIKIPITVFVVSILSVFTYLAMHIPYMGWFLYFFLFPFWSLFPTAIHGANVGSVVFLIYAVGVGIYKLYHLVIPSGRKRMKKIRTKSFGGSGSWGGSSSGRSSSGGFSGGGGSFGGGGSSGSW